MNKIHAAYLRLGVAVGAQFDVVKRRYRHLAMVWHPDRMTNPEGRRANEEELKQINNAFDCIKKHFQSEHRPGPECECQPAAPQDQQDRQWEEQFDEWWRANEARAAADRQRRREEEAQEAALKEALERAAKEAAAQAAAAAAAKARAEYPPLTGDQLRWYIATGLAVMFALLLIGGFNKRYEPSSHPDSEFSLSNSQVMPCF